MTTPSNGPPAALPRVAITYCTQCRWMLRAAYLGQELLSTFGTSIGEVALIPATGGTFKVHLTYKPVAASKDDGAEADQSEHVLIWDYATNKTFPEAKILKQRVRDHIDPGRGLGHSDTPSRTDVKSGEKAAAGAEPVTSVNGSSDPKAGGQSSKDDCEDCK